MLSPLRRTCSLFGLALALSTGSGLAWAKPGDALPPRICLGYVFGSNDKIDFRLYTHLAHAFVTADAEGRLQTNNLVPAPSLTAQAHAAGVQVLLSLGGWGWDEQFAAIGRSPAAEERYTSAILKIVDEADYDGIDFDWEYPDTPEEVVSFERMTRKFRAGVDAIGQRKGRPLRITMAASSNAGTLSHLSTAFLVETMDWVNVMTYDYTGDWTDYAGHHAPLFASSKAPGPKRSVHDTIEYLVGERKFPADRIALGIPLYGRGFGVAEPYASTKGAKKAIPDGGYATFNRLQQQGWRRVWDDQTKTPWLLSPDHKAVVGYDDPESVATKARYAVDHHLRGVFFWEVHADRLPDGSHPLQEAARRVWVPNPK